MPRQKKSNQFSVFGTRDLICVDGWNAQELQDLIAQRQLNQQPEKPSLPAA